MRTAFQDSHSNALRVTVDEELDMSLESLQRMQESGGALGLWLQEGFVTEEAGQGEGEPREASSVHPFPAIPERRRFPYAVLELKVGAGDGGAASARPCEALSCAVQRLALAELLLEVPSFSKFQHAVALLMPGHPGIPNSPWWFVEDSNGVTRPAAFEDLQSAAKGRSSSPGRDVSPLSPTATAATVATSASGKNFLHPLFAAPSRVDLARALSTGSAAPPLVRRGKKAAGKERREEDGSKAGGGRAGEPRTFFANERTFLSWLNVAVLLLFTGLAFMGGSEVNPVSVRLQPPHSQQQQGEEDVNSGGEGAAVWQRIPGLVIAPVALVFMVYALVQYQYRAWKIRARDSIIRYDDLWGPSLLTAFLLLASVAAFAVSLNTSKIL
jgi:uncharacterized membrane protein YidH (DUF202 family)